MDYAGFGRDIHQQSTDLLENAFDDPKWLERTIINFIQFQTERVERNEIVPTTISNYTKALKTFLDMNDYMDGLINWRKIRRGPPPRKNAADDRAPTREEIKKLLEFPDRRIKIIILVMLSSGIRIAAWDYLKWKHVKAFYDDNDRIMAARLLVYAGEPEQYITFITPEAYEALKQWMEFRASFGERITSDSPLMRDAWQTTNVKQWQRLGLATHPNHKAGSRALDRFL
jgi:integrase